MLPLRFSAAIFVLFSFSLCLACPADTVPNSETQASAQISEIDFVESEAAVTLEEDTESITVPEPATFGLITLGLAVAGGLLVRNRLETD